MRILKRITKGIIVQVRDKLFCAAIKTRMTALIYGHLVCRDLDREMIAFLEGKRKYELEASGPDSSLALLRRNTHRLEKGLIMQPRRAMFAEEYIEETVQSFLKHVGRANSDNDTTKWARDVLSIYFDAVTLPEKLTYLEREFGAVVPVVQDASLSVPYARSTSPELSVSYEEFYQLCLRRRSVRWYKDEKVPRELIDKAIGAARLSPSACNRQPFEFYVVDDPAQAREIGAIPMGTAGYSSNFQVFIIVVGNMHNYPFARDRHLIYIDGSLASMTLMLALETLGLASCPINWPDIEALEEKMADALNLEIYQRPVLCLSVGYATDEGGVPFSSKKGLSELRRYL